MYVKFFIYLVQHKFPFKMKKITLLFFTLLIFSCSADDDNSSNGVDYFFEVEFGGVINRVQESTGDYLIFNYINKNKCYGTTSGVNLSISDITNEDYVSGQNMNLFISFDNAQLGSNTGTIIIFDGFYIKEYLESIGATSDTEFVENIGDGGGGRGIMSNINITDLGTPLTYDKRGQPVYGETIKASYDKVVYFRSIDTRDYDIPVSIRIEFSAVRL